MLYLDESIVRCFLSGLYLAIGAVWLAWLASWINRVELRCRATGTVTQLGLRFEREGLRSLVSASGKVSGRELRVRWRTGLLGERVEAALDGGPWRAAPEDCELAEWLRAVPG